MKNPDEDYCYGQWKQKQIDEDRTRLQLISKGVIGSALRDSEKIAKFERTDPNPRIPFVEQEPVISRREKVLIIVLPIVWLTAWIVWWVA